MTIAMELSGKGLNPTVSTVGVPVATGYKPCTV